jgi:hypothetical protein
VFEAEFHFNTSQSFTKDLVVIAVSLAVVYGAVKLWLHKSKGKASDGRR